jgi:carbonic anhydrase
MEQQSPVDIRQAMPGEVALIAFQYGAVPLHVVNTGHTIQANISPGLHLSLAGRQFPLLQFHFHAPSEHLVQGAPLDMELHLVHQSSDGELAVVGVFFRMGVAHPTIRILWDNLPDQAGDEFQSEELTIDPLDLVPAQSSVYTYTGSLTTPPYTEGVQWILFNDPLPVPPEQVERFKALFGTNARPVQPLGDRTICIEEYSR